MTLLLPFGLWRLPAELGDSVLVSRSGLSAQCSESPRFCPRSVDFAPETEPLGAFPDVLLFRGAEVTDGYVLA